MEALEAPGEGRNRKATEMLTKQMATMLAAAVMVAGSAWGYGAEGWSNGTPDHVMKAGKHTQTTQACCCGKDCNDGCKKGNGGK
jgi:hypothetical protein